MTEKRNKKGQFNTGDNTTPEEKRKLVESLKGNTYSNKLFKNPTECQKAYEEYCDWISNGHSVESWCYESQTLTLTYKTIEKYIREFPLDFPPIHKETALTKSLRVWEERGLTMMLGQLEKCQPAIFQMFMRNKFGWDKEDTTKKNSNETIVEKFLGIMDKMDDKKD